MKKPAKRLGNSDVNHNELTEIWHSGDVVDNMVNAPSKSLVETLSSSKTKRPWNRQPEYIGPYPIVKQIGEGASSTVYLGKHLGLDREIAVKVVKLNLWKDREQSVERFIQEARMMDQLNHPNIIRVYDVGEDEFEGLYIAMEYAEKGSLEKLLKGKKPLNIDFARAIIRSIAKALGAAHERNIIHRDVKPQNIMLTKDGHVKLADLGLAKYIHYEDDGSLSHEPKGTPAYMAPEQFENAKHVDTRADIYGLGATFYQLVTGYCPFTGCSPFEIMRKKVREGEAKKPERINPSVDKRTSDIISRMMAINPEDRYQSVKEIWRILDAKKIRKVPNNIFSKKRNLLGAVGVFLIISMTIMVASSLMMMLMTKPESDWLGLVKQFNSKIEIRYGQLKEGNLGEKYSSYFKKINDLRSMAKASFASQNYQRVLDVDLMIWKLLKKLEDAKKLSHNCLEKKTELGDTMRRTLQLFPDSKNSKNWRIIEELKSDATAQLEAGNFENAYEIYHDAFEKMNQIINKLAPKRIEQFSLEMAKNKVPEAAPEWHKENHHLKSAVHQVQQVESEAATAELAEDSMKDQKNQKELSIDTDEVYNHLASPTAENQWQLAALGLSENRGFSNDLSMAAKDNSLISHPDLNRVNDNKSDIKRIGKEVPNRRIQVDLRLRGDKKTYVEGEKIQLIVRPEKDCYLAVFAHYSDRSTVLLFPNVYNNNTLVFGDQVVDIPGDYGSTNKLGFKFEAGEPFGTDVIQVIACTKKKALYTLFELKEPIPNSPLATISRTNVIRGLRGAQRGINLVAADPLANSYSEPEFVEWGEVQLQIYTQAR